MPFLSLNLNDVKEPTAAPKDSYELQITGAVTQESGSNSKHPGTAMVKFTLGFVDPEIDSPAFNHYMVFPYEGQTEYLNLTLLGIKRFLVHFGIPYGDEGFDTDTIAFEALGKVAVCNVDLTPPNENGDIYNKLGYLPKLREEGQGNRKANNRKRS
jgi:hypothetical protein